MCKMCGTGAEVAETQWLPNIISDILYNTEKREHIKALSHIGVLSARTLKTWQASCPFFQVWQRRAPGEAIIRL